MALVPLVRLLVRSETSAAQSVRAGLAFGAAFYLPLAHWLPATLHGLIPGGLLVGGLGLVILVGIAGLQGRALHWLLRLGWAPPALALPAVWVTAEFVVARAGPVAFPWTPLGLALASVPSLAGPAELGGVGMLTLWICLVNGWIGGAWSRPHALAPRPAAVLAGLLVLLVVPGAWGIHRAEALPDRELPSVDLVQIHLPRAVLLDRQLRDREAGAALRRLLGEGPPAPLPGPPDGSVAGDPSGPDASASASDTSGVLLILPEAPFASSWEDGVAERMAGLARARRAPVLAGARFRHEGRPRNGVILVDRDGREQLRHGKVRLVPAAEWPELAPGPDRGAIQAGGISVATLICFEMGFGGRARALVRQGAELLSNPTLDGWLRPGPMGLPGSWWSAALAQHRAHLVLRAVETRRGAVRSSVSGELLVVDPSGRIRERRPAGAEGVVRVQPRTTELRTGFLRVGDVGGASGMLLLAVVFLGSAQVRRRPSAGDPLPDGPRPGG